MNFNQFNPQISLSKNLSAVTACDDLGTVTKTRLGFRREKCNSLCSEGIDEDTCRDVKFGVVRRNGECYLNSDQIMKYRWTEKEIERRNRDLDGRSNISIYGNTSFYY